MSVPRRVLDRGQIGERRMSGLELNKIVGAIMLVALTLAVIGQIGNALLSPRLTTTVAVAVPEGAPPGAPTTSATAAAPEPIAPLLASASIDAGKSVAKKCVACHTFEKDGPNRIGPNLWGVIGGTKARQQNFSYSAGMKALGGTWSYDDLNAFLFKPADFIKGTKMAFVGLPKTTERAAVVAYLRSLSDAPVALP